MEFEGIVIRRTTYKEGAAMITVLTKDKIRSFLAKGVLKMTSKNAPSVNLFTKSRFQVFHGQDGDWLRVGEIIKSYPEITKDLEKLAILDFISELTNTLLESNDAKNIYDYLSKTLDALEGGFHAWTALGIYFAHVLLAAGYGLNVDKCAICGQTSSIISLSYKDSGFICENCFDQTRHTKTDVRKLKIMRYIFKVDLDNFDRVTFGKEEIKQIIFELADFLDWTSQIKFKSLTLLSQI
ncbi:MAG: DNA repair protein RecO [Firmicutes bacterium]|nr:DNA repair protein RecO [Candidatus Fiminaster equi]